MHVIETVSLGGRRQLSLVSCGDERFLVGCGADQIQTIVQITKAGTLCR
jgi:flagellar biogenesis protein FliO